MSIPVAIHRSTRRAHLVLGVACVALLATLAWGQAPSGSLGTGSSTQSEGERIREGTLLVDRPGQFLRSAGRLTFQTLDDERFIALENLALERVAQQIQDDPEPLEWSVSGMVTEYSSANYLLVTRAVLRARNDRRTTVRGREF